MGKRISFEDAVKYGWVKPTEVPKSARGRSTLRNGKSAGKRAAEKEAPAPRLWAALKHLPGAHQELAGVVPDRKFRIDVAFPGARLAIEVL